jgi:hypothetical protein
MKFDTRIGLVIEIVILLLDVYIMIYKDGLKKIKILKVQGKKIDLLDFLDVDVI